MSGRVRLKRDGWVGRLPCYLAFVDAVLVGAVVGIDPAPGNPTRATAWRVQPTGHDEVVQDRLADARRWLHEHADDLLAAAAAVRRPPPRPQELAWVLGEVLVAVSDDRPFADVIALLDRAAVAGGTTFSAVWASPAAQAWHERVQVPPSE